MSAVFRVDEDDPIEVPESWNLDEQIEAAIAWLADDQNARKVRGQVLDIGFNSRLDGKTVVQGETIPLEFMCRLITYEITLWLSIYSPFKNDKNES